MKKLIFVAFLSLVAFNSHANDSERISALEKELNAMKIRLTKVESLLVDSSATQLPLAKKDGWKSLSNWRSLKTGMNPSEVKDILGEPQRIKGGEITFWYYQNGSSVTFMSDKVYSWTEPR
jgi:hypothetical protein